MESPELNLTVESRTAREPVVFPVRRLVCAGWVGRDKRSLQAHIDELAQHGVPGPTRIPIYLNFSPSLTTTSDVVYVISPETSGEVEYVVLKGAARTYVGVGSDHTDRGLEKFSIPASKQLYSKVLAPVVWPYEEIVVHWNRIVIRSWATVEGERILYQEDLLEAILDAEDLLEQLPRGDGLPTDDMILFSGTPATKMGLVYAEHFDFEMEDPVLGRKTRHGYKVRVLPQYL